MQRKAQGLSINVIIVAVIALVVLVVLIAIFTGRLAIFSGGVSDVSSCQQICTARNYDIGQDFETDAEAEADDFIKLIGARDGDGNQCYCKNS